MTDEQENGLAPTHPSGRQTTNRASGENSGISKLSSGDVVGRFSEGLVR